MRDTFVLTGQENKVCAIILGTQDEIVMEAIKEDGCYKECKKVLITPDNICDFQVQAICVTEDDEEEEVDYYLTAATLYQ